MTAALAPTVRTFRRGAPLRRHDCDLAVPLRRGPGAVIALVGIAALAALIRRHTGMEVGMALPLIAMVGLVVLVWVVFAFVALALVAGG